MGHTCLCCRAHSYRWEPLHNLDGDDDRRAPSLIHPLFLTTITARFNHCASSHDINIMSSHNELISPVTTKSPDFVITPASLNNEPIELDSKPMSPEQIKAIQTESMTTEERQVCTSCTYFERSLQLAIAETTSDFRAQRRSCCPGRYSADTRRRTAGQIWCRRRRVG